MVTKRKLRRRRQRKLKATSQLILDRLVEHMRPEIEAEASKVIHEHFFGESEFTGIKAILESKPSEMHRNWAFSKEVKAEPLTAEMLERQMQKAKEGYDKPWEPVIYLSNAAYEVLANASKEEIETAYMKRLRDAGDPKLIDALKNGDWDIATLNPNSASKPKPE